MRILLVHNYHRERGGESGVVDMQLDLLREHGQDVRLYSRDSREVTPTIRYGIGAIFSLRTYREVRAAVRDFRPEVAHLHHIMPLISPSVYYALKHEGVPIVHTLHNYLLLCPNGLFYTHGQLCERCKHGNTAHAIRLKCYQNSRVISGLYALIIGMHRWLGTFRLVDQFIVPSEFVGRKVIEGGLVSEDRVKVVGNFTQMIPRKTETSGEQPYVVFMGRLSEEKGVMTLIKSLTPDVEIGVKILGDGSLRGVLEAAAKARGLTKIEFLGHVRDKAHVLAGASALIAPSVVHETFGISVLEGMLAGLPILAADVGNFRSLVRHGETGFLFPPGDSQRLGDHLRWIVANPEQARVMGACGQEFAAQFSTQAHYERLMQVYRSVTP